MSIARRPSPAVTILLIASAVLGGVAWAVRASTMMPEPLSVLAGRPAVVQANAVAPPSPELADDTPVSGTNRVGRFRFGIESDRTENLANTVRLAVAGRLLQPKSSPE